jgi:hypothetical protein
MVAMFMSDQHRTDLIRIKGRSLYSLERLFCAQSCIQKECPALSFKKNTIAFAPAGKNRAAHRPIIGSSRIRLFNYSRLC